MTDTGAVAVINPLIKGELVATHAYLLQARMCENWGYKKLAAHLAKEAAEETAHASRLVDRVLVLGGLPDLDRPPPPADTTVPGLLKTTVRLEREAVANYREAALKCLKLGDVVSFEMFSDLAADEEGHLVWAETQLHLLEEMGLENFLAEWV